MSHALLPIILGAAVAPFAPPAPLAGAFLLEAVPLDGSPYPAKRNCLMVRINRSRPALHHFGGDGACGLDTEGPTAAMVRDIVPIVASDGRTAHLLRSRANGKCLAQGKRHPTLHLWDDNPDKRWCGLASADALIDNAQAAWFFDDIAVDGPARHVGALRIEMDAPLFMTFDRGTEGPADFAEETDVATMFRLTPVAP